MGAVVIAIAFFLKVVVIALGGITATSQKLASDHPHSGNKEKLEAYIDSNYEHIAQEAATECGEYVNGLYTLYINYAVIGDNGIDDEDSNFDDENGSKITQDDLCVVLKKNYNALFDNQTGNDFFLVDLDKDINNYDRNSAIGNEM
jgi:hypothetical protein